MDIFDAAQRYRTEEKQVIVLAGKEYGSGSSRDWAAKGTALLGVKAVIAESYERIHRSNLVGMGILPLQFRQGESAETLRLAGTESYDITGLTGESMEEATITATTTEGERIEFKATIRIDTPQEREYYRHGGILHYVLRSLVREAA